RSPPILSPFPYTTLFRSYAEIFNQVSPRGYFLPIDSSVMHLMTSRDKSLPQELVFDADGREKFRKYLPAQTNATTPVSLGSFVTDRKSTRLNSSHEWISY